ncbi:MAG: hypothetical protein AVDCRST_MAG78-1269, partial [uncultured Rubrobacteraceae bacterium]
GYSSLDFGGPRRRGAGQDRHAGAGSRRHNPDYCNRHRGSRYWWLRRQQPSGRAERLRFQSDVHSGGDFGVYHPPGLVPPGHTPDGV